jgi:hypothetical protein
MDGKERRGEGMKAKSVKRKCNKIKDERKEKK